MRLQTHSSRFLLAKLRLWGAVLVAFCFINSQVAAQDNPLDNQPHLLQEPIQLAQFNLFEELFGPKKKRPQSNKRNNQRSTTNNGQNSAAAPARPRLAKVKLTKKDPDALKLLVLGDSMANDLARALDRIYKDDPKIQIVGRTVSSSGLVRPDFYNWPKFVNDYVANDQVDLAIIYMGINDRQDIRMPRVQGKKRVRFKTLTDDWQNEYRVRVDQIHAGFQQANVPVIWVGLPPMSKRNYSAAISQINALQQAETVGNQGRFVDIWDVFLSPEGTYTRFGATLEGQRVRMRAGNGIHFTKRGADKVALFVDREIKTIYKGGTISLAIADPLDGTDAQYMMRPPFQSMGGGVRIEFAGPRLSLNQVPKDDGQLLQVDMTKLIQKTPEVTLADLAQAPEGRADDFVWVREAPEEPVQATQFQEITLPENLSNEQLAAR